MLRRALVVGLVGLGCASQSAAPEPATRVIATSVPPLETDALDVLFVVDDSGSTVDDRAELVAQAQAALFDVLHRDRGRKPDLHVGVTTTSLSIPNVRDCEDGADGRIFGAPGWDGTLADALAQVPADGRGCQYEQPLAAAARAVSGTIAENRGFVREGALLVVVFLTDEDDCSSTNDGLFDPNASLGPADSYRCFRHMITCDEPLDQPGRKRHCVPDDASPYGVPIDELADALVAAKGGDASQVIVATVAGPSGSVIRVEQEASCSRMWVGNACGSRAVTATPAVRLDAFRARFPGRTLAGDLCGGDLDDPFRHTAELIDDVAMRRGCLRGDLAEPLACGVVAAEGVDGVGGAPLPACASGATPCVEIVADAACGASGRRVRIEDPRRALAGRHVVATCDGR